MVPSLLVAVRAGTAVSWGNAWLAGLVSLDEAAAAVTGDDPPHVLTGLPGDPEPTTWAVALGRLRGAGITGLQLALPAPGDPLGLAGPVELNARVVAAGAAVLALGPAGAYGIVPAAAAGAAPSWVVSAAHPPAPPPSPAEAARALAGAVRASTVRLEQLDVARRQPGTAGAQVAAERLLAARPVADPAARTAELLASGVRLLVAVEQALQVEGGAVTAAEAAARAQALRPVAAAARRAVVAAYSAAPESGRHHRAG